MQCYEQALYLPGGGTADTVACLCTSGIRSTIFRITRTSSFSSPSLRHHSHPPTGACRWDKGPLTSRGPVLRLHFRTTFPVPHPVSRSQRKSPDRQKERNDRRERRRGDGRRRPQSADCRRAQDDGEKQQDRQKKKKKKGWMDLHTRPTRNAASPYRLCQERERERQIKREQQQSGHGRTQAGCFQTRKHL